MKGLLILLLALSAHGETFNLVKGKASYTVKHLLKTVKGTSEGVKGKMLCEKDECEFLIAIPVKTFTSSDSNRDDTMYGILETDIYGIISGKGKFPRKELDQKTFTMNSEIDFHGKKVVYPIQVQDRGKRAQVILDLEKHQVERPSLFMAKIEKEVPVDFEFQWNP